MTEHATPESTTETRPVPPVFVSNVSHRIEGISILKNISFSVAASEIYGLVGAVGAGKTTLARLLASATEPTSGAIEIGGFSTVFEPDRARRALGYLPNPAAMPARLTVLEYLEFFARLTTKMGASSLIAALERTRLGHRKNQLIAQLNEGQRQRLGLARALLHDPDVLILDEPMSNVDPMRRDALGTLLRELRSSGKALVLLSPILSGLGELCDRIGILHHGRILAQGSPNDIVERVGAKSIRSGLAAIQERLSLESQLEDRRSYLDPIPAERLHVSASTSSRPPPASEPLDTQRLRVRCLGDASVAAALAREFLGVSQVETLPDGSLLIAHQSDDVFVSELVQHLITKGIKLVSVEPQHSELERIFRSLTQGAS